MELIRARKARLSIDMAPLIDVVFQLLVFFMLTSTFSRPVMKLDLPKAVSGAPTKNERVIISVAQDGLLDINGTPISEKLFPLRLKEALSLSETKAVNIRGDADMPYKFFVNIMDTARQAGAVQVNIVHDGPGP